MRYSIKDTDLLIVRRAHDAIRREWELVKREFYARKFDPDQPRAPAGSPDGGRWTSGGGTAAPETTGSGTTSERAGSVTVAAVRGNAAKCEAQYEADSRLCRIVKTPLCWQQAMKRRAACVSGYDLPPLNF
jgi:hypothetical protein